MASNNVNKVVLSEAEKIQVKKDIRNLKSKIRLRLKNIEKRFGKNAEPLSSFKQLDLAKNIGKLNDAQLLHQRRLLSQFNNKQFTRVRGYQHYKDWKKSYDIVDLTEKEESIMWELYNKYVEENKIAEHYKYETLQVISEELESGSTAYEIHERLNELYASEIGLDQNTDIPFSTRFKRRYKN